MFIERVVALEPNDFVFAGAYTFKSGYHSSVTDNLANFAPNYSIRLAADLVTYNRAYGRAVDVKSRQAASGAAPTIMARYGQRMRDAAYARDPRVSKWREVLGQFDVDIPPEAIDFQSVAERVPDSTHVWHIHWSILTMWVNDPEAYAAMYSVLIGQTLAAYQQQGDDMSDWTEPLTQGAPGYAGQQRDTALAFAWKASNEAAQGVVKLIAAAEADEVRDKAVLAAITALTTGGGDVDTAIVVNAVNEVRDEARARFAELLAAVGEAEDRAAQAEAEVIALREALQEAHRRASDALDVPQE
jgi:hypothetical protein